MNYFKDFLYSKDNLRQKIFILLLVITLVWLENMLSKSVNFKKNSNVNITNHYINTFSMQQTDNKGNIKWNLHGDRLEKYPNSERSEVINPHMIVNSTNDEKWNVTAKHALDPNSKFESIYLTDNVKFQKFDKSKKSLVLVMTTSAIVYPDKEIVETDAYATILTPDSKTTGDGVIANIKDGYVKILSNAKRTATTEEKSEKLEGGQMLYNLNTESWQIININEDSKEKIKGRVKTILKTKRKGNN